MHLPALTHDEGPRSAGAFQEFLVTQQSQAIGREATGMNEPAGISETLLDDVTFKVAICDHPSILDRLLEHWSSIFTEHEARNITFVPMEESTALAGRFSRLQIETLTSQWWPSLL